MKSDAEYDEMIQLFIKVIDDLVKGKALLQHRLDIKSNTERRKVARPHDKITGQFVSTKTTKLGALK